MARRVAHYVKANDRSETIHESVWFDCETTPHTDQDGVTTHVLEFGWASYRRRGPSGNWLQPKWFRFTKGEELWEWINGLMRNRKTMYVWSHNTSFDYMASSGSTSLRSLGWSMMTAIVDSPPFILTWHNDSRRIMVTDTLNIWRMSLEKMGKLTGLEKLRMPDVWTGSLDDDEYCRRDVEIIMNAVCQWADFLRDEDMGKFCLTVASQSMQTFRHRYLRHNILIDTNKQALDISRKSYHGGRVECFYVGHKLGPLYLLDINSLYPYVMATNDFPIHLVTTLRRVPISELSDILTRYMCCAHVTAVMREPSIPVVVKGKLVFPTGRVNAYITTPEIQHCIQNDELREVQEVAVYEKASPFVEFVTDLYNRRLAAKNSGKLVEAEHYKLLLNSFYGKWGQNGIKWVTTGRTDDHSIKFWPVVDIDEDTVTNYRQFDGLIQRRDIEPESANSHPAIAAHITAYARMVLLALTRQIPPKHYFYCDTDSILCDEVGLEHVKERIDNDVLGGLKLVGEYPEVTIYGCKDYVLGSQRVCKGVREKAVEIEPNTYRQEQWIGFKRALRKGWTDSPRVIQITKTLRRAYDKGVVGIDGFVLPLHF